MFQSKRCGSMGLNLRRVALSSVYASYTDRTASKTSFENLLVKCPKTGKHYTTQLDYIAYSIPSSACETTSPIWNTCFQLLSCGWYYARQRCNCWSGQHSVWNAGKRGTGPLHIGLSKGCSRLLILKPDQQCGHFLDFHYLSRYRLDHLGCIISLCIAFQFSSRVTSKREQRCSSQHPIRRTLPRPALPRNIVSCFPLKLHCTHELSLELWARTAEA